MTVASLAARSSGRQQLLWLLLAVSLALNLFFVTAFLWSRFRDSPPPIYAEERLEWIGAQLRLDPQQKEAFSQYAQAVRANMQTMHAAVDPLMGKAWSEVAKPNADVATVVQLFDEAGHFLMEDEPDRVARADHSVVPGEIVPRTTGEICRAGAAAPVGKAAPRRRPVGLGFRQPEHLTGINALGIAYLALVGRIDNQVAGADTVGTARNLPQIVAWLHSIGLPRR